MIAPHNISTVIIPAIAGTFKYIATIIAIKFIIYLAIPKYLRILKSFFIDIRLAVIPIVMVVGIRINKVNNSIILLFLSAIILHNYITFYYLRQLLRYSSIKSSISPFITASMFPTS